MVLGFVLLPTTANAVTTYAPTTTKNIDVNAPWGVMHFVPITTDYVTYWDTYQVNYGFQPSSWYTSQGMTNSGPFEPGVHYWDINNLAYSGGNEDMYVNGYGGVVSYQYSCNSGDTLNGDNLCVVAGSSSSGGTFGAVSNFFSPVQDFLTDRLLPAIGLLVVLGIGVRLSIRAVRKFSKVA